MRELNLDEIHMVTLEIMDHLHEICEANGIQYFLHFGTLLGAVRHRGFIPWDDDFDITLKRTDFTELCNVLSAERHPYYKLCTRSNTKDYCYGIPRYVDTRYQYVSELKQLKQVDMGVFIDMYPLDFCSPSIKEVRQIKRKCTKLNRAYMIYTNRRSVRGWPYTVLRTPVHWYYRMRYGNNFPFQIDDMIYGIITKSFDENSEFISLLCWGESLNIYPKEWFAVSQLSPFEDRMYHIPLNYDDVLRRVYGDYMTMPPENERVPQHQYRILV